MKPLPYIAFSILALLLLIPAFCDRPTPTSTTSVNIDSLKAIGRAEQDTLETLRRIATQSQQTATVAVHHWHKAKHDTIHDTIPVPYIVLINRCDTALSALEQANTDLCNELNQCYEVNAAQNRVMEAHEANHEMVVDSLVKRGRKRFWNGFKCGAATGYAAGVATPRGR